MSLLHTYMLLDTYIKHITSITPLRCEVPIFLVPHFTWLLEMSHETGVCCYWSDEQQMFCDILTVSPHQCAYKQCEGVRQGCQVAIHAEALRVV